MKRSFRIAAVGAAASPLKAAAVDGVGLSGAFPILEWLFWLLLLIMAAKVFSRGVFPIGPAPSPFRRRISIALIVLLLSPMLVAFLSPLYVRALCTTAALQVDVPPGGWTPPPPGTKASHRSRMNDRDEVETNTIPGLLEYYGRDGAWLDAWRYNHRLVDQATGKTLISASYFGSGRTGPMTCPAAASYWSLYREFKDKAFAGARE